MRSALGAMDPRITATLLTSVCVIPYGLVLRSCIFLIQDPVPMSILRSCTWVSVWPEQTTLVSAAHGNISCVKEIPINYADSWALRQMRQLSAVRGCRLYRIVVNRLRKFKMAIVSRVCFVLLLLAAIGAARKKPVRKKTQVKIKVLCDIYQKWTPKLCII